MTEFTPGPWLPEKGFYGWWSAVASSTGFEIARIESGEANARLVAAAPRLFEAVSRAADLCVGLRMEHPHNQGIAEIGDQCRAALRDVLGKS